MANRKRTVEIDFIADTDKATRGIKQVGDTAEKEGGRLQKMGDKAKLGFAAAAVGVGVAIDFLKDAAVAAAEDEKAQADLARQLQASTKATDDQIESTEEWIDATARATGIADDELRPALETLARATGDLDEAQDLLTTSMDIATATGKPLQTVVEAISKAALNGSTGGLSRLGLKIKDVNGEMLTLDEIMQNAEKSMGGATAEAADTAAGKMARLQIAVDEAKEGFGQLILLPVAEWLSDIFFSLEQPGDQNFLDAILTDIRALGDETENRKENPMIQGLIDSFGALAEMLNLKTRPSIEQTSSALSIAAGEGDGARRAMEEIIPDLSNVAGGMDDVAGSASDVAGAVDDATEAFYDNQAAVAAQMDPLFAYSEAQGRVKEATDKAREAAKEFGEGSPEHIAALHDVRDAAEDVRGAEARMADSTNVTAEQMKTYLRSLGQFTEDEINRMIAEFERINAFRFDPKSITIVRRITGGGPQEFHSGGVVQGDFPGQEVLVSARAGEPFGSAVPANGHGGLTVNVQGSVISERELIDIVREASIRDSRRGRSWS